MGLCWDRRDENRGIIFHNSLLFVPNGKDVTVLDRTTHKVVMVITNADNFMFPEEVVDSDEYISMAEINNKKA